MSEICQAKFIFAVSWEYNSVISLAQSQWCLLLLDILFLNTRIFFRWLLYLQIRELPPEVDRTSYF